MSTLRISTPRLELRIPDPAQWRTYAEAVAGRVVGPESAHFVGSWAQLVSPEFEESFVAARHRTLTSCTASRWGIELGAFLDEELVGQASLYGRDFLVAREVITASGLRADLRGRGLGTEMRAGILALAFTRVGAKVAWSGASLDNVASNRVSEKLGYENVGLETRKTGGGEAVFTRQRLAMEVWKPTTGIRVAGGESLAELLD